MTQITTTLNRIRDCSPCTDEWPVLLAALGKVRADDEPISYARFVETNGIQPALWAIRAEPEMAATWRLFAVACVRHFQHLLPDERCLAALDVAERHARGEAADLKQADRDALQALKEAAGSVTRDQQFAMDAARFTVREDAVRAVEKTTNALALISGWEPIKTVFLAHVGGV